MKRKEIIALREKSQADLEKLLAEHEAEFEKLRMSHVAGKLKNVRSMHLAKKDIARIMTNLSIMSRETKNI